MATTDLLNHIGDAGWYYDYETDALIRPDGSIPEPSFVLSNGCLRIRLSSEEALELLRLAVNDHWRDLDKFLSTEVKPA